MRKTFVVLAVAALTGAATPAGAELPAGFEGRYGTSSCYVYVGEPPPPPTIQTTWPFVVFPPSGGPLHEVHCPIPPLG